MGKFNDLDLKEWQNCDINTDSLWLIDKRDNSGKLGNGEIMRYRALISDYFIFKHEYIFVFKKENN